MWSGGGATPRVPSDGLCAAQGGRREGAAPGPLALRPSAADHGGIRDLLRLRAWFKVREDLKSIGIAIPDAYQDGTTLDPATGRHRSILPAALGRTGPELWSRSAARLSLVEGLLGRIDALSDRALAAAAEWLLFQML